MGVINIAAIKTQIKSALDSNNTTTSAILDLSSGLSQRVQQVATVNPEMLPIQATAMPVVTISLESKSIEQKTIAKNQVDGKRMARLRFKITAMVWNQNSFSSSPFTDPAANDLEILMENIEYLLRNYPDLSSAVTWQFPTDATYHHASLDEQSHFRVGFLDLEAAIYY